ncbi:MAG TPA: hypothetical protein VFH70_13390 [Acidimicrobiales bacterium]|nr:hypothetical protein [Acidimicrobiales bacterium]
MTEDPELQLAAYGRTLADAIEAAIPGWVVRQVRKVMEAQSGDCPSAVSEEAAVAGRQAGDDVGPRIRQLLAADVDDQRTTPLAIIRGAVRYPTEVLRAAGAAPAARDRFAVQSFPDDVYDLTPASFADLDPDDPGLAEAGLSWGAAKAFVHRRRHS